MKSYNRKISAFIAISAMFALILLKFLRIGNQNTSFVLRIVNNNLANLFISIGLPYFIYNLRLWFSKNKSENINLYIALSFTVLILVEVFQFTVFKNPHDPFDIAAIVLGIWIARKLKSLLI